MMSKGLYTLAERVFGDEPNFNSVETAFDEDSAADFLAELRQRGVGWDQAKDYFEFWLRDKRVVASLIPVHMKNIEAYFRPRLD